jgi:hypothetical protein
VLPCGRRHSNPQRPAVDHAAISSARSSASRHVNNFGGSPVEGTAWDHGGVREAVPRVLRDQGRGRGAVLRDKASMVAPAKQVGERVTHKWTWRRRPPKANRSSPGRGARRCRDGPLMPTRREPPDPSWGQWPDGQCCDSHVASVDVLGRLLGSDQPRGRRTPF